MTMCLNLSISELKLLYSLPYEGRPFPFRCKIERIPSGEKKNNRKYSPKFKLSRYETVRNREE